MSQEGYGYVDPEKEIGGVSAGTFGLNQASVFLKSWDFTENGGKGGEPGEALIIVFDIGGAEKSMRKFPITKAFLPNNAGETTDPTHQEFKDAVRDQNAILMHILHRFVAKDVLMGALSVPGMTFRQFCETTKSLLPSNFPTVRLDMFLQYQFAIKGENSRTFLEIPPKMKHGIWLELAQRPLNADGTTGRWEEVRKPLQGLEDNDQNALTYVDGQGNVHPFKRNGWFVKSNFANQLTDPNAGNTSAAASMGPPPTQLPPTGTPPVGTPPVGTPPAGVPPTGSTPDAAPGW